MISAFANSPRTKKKDIIAFHMNSECDKNKDKYNSIDYIDQESQATDQVDKIKGYVTVEESNVLNKQPLSSDKDTVSDVDGSTSTGQSTKGLIKPKSKTKQKSNGTKKKCRKEKTKSASSSESVRIEPSRNSEERVLKTKGTTTETTKVVTTTTSLNRYTITQINDVGNGNSDKKVRTHSCSSIPYDDIIDNLAVFRKSFDNVQFFHDESQNLVPIENITEKKVCIKIPEAMDSDNHVRNFATTFIADIIESASKVINNKATSADVQKINEYDSVSDSTSQENRLKCETSSTALYAPIIIHTPATDNLDDAQNFVEEYEEYHDSCSEISDGKLNVLTTDVAVGNNDKVPDKPKGKKKKDKTVKLGVTRCIPVETDSNAEDDSDFPQSEMQLVPYDAKFNLPKNIFSKMNNTEMVEITDQNIDILHQNVEIAENNPDMMEQPVLNVFKTQENKEFVVEDEDDVYKPIAVSPCGRFFKYEEEVI